MGEVLDDHGMDVRPDRAKGRGRCTQDTRDSSRVTLLLVVDGAAEDLDTDVSVEETEVEVALIGWFE